MASVALEKLSKRYRGGDRPVVRELDLSIADGEFVSLVGPSGCGKSTTLSLIAGLESPTSGAVRIDGQVVNDRSPGERDVAMVFQSYALYPHLDVRKNLAFPLGIAGLSHQEIDERVRQTAEMLGLDALLGRKPAELSGGQRQRVALGRALVRRPKAFLFDEPLSNLDAGLRAQMRGELKKLHERLRATFIYVTHDQAEAMTLSDRVAVMKEGQLLQVGPPRELYERPQSVFVATFFGVPSINLAPPSALGLQGPDTVSVGVRPEDVEIGLGAAPEGALAGEVYVIEPMGAECWATVQLPGARITARAPGTFQAPSNAPAWVRIDASRVHRFDAATQQRVG